MYTRTLPDGTIETLEHGRVVSRLWSNKRCEEFTEQCHPGRIRLHKAIEGYFKKYGYATGDNGNGIRMTVYYFLRRNGRFLKMRTYSYGDTLVVGFNSKEDAEHKAKELGAEVYASSYSQGLALNGKEIPASEFLEP